VIRRTILARRNAVLRLLEEAAELRLPREEVDLEATADLSTVLLEGAFIAFKTLGEADLWARQVRRSREQLELIFAD